MTQLPMKAKVMIGMVAVASLFALAYSAEQRQTQAWPQLAMLAAAAAVTSRLKVKIPGTTSSMSGNLPIILLAVTQLGLFASLLVAAVAAMAQSYNSSKTKAVQFVFNTCTLLNATSIAYLAYHRPLTTAPNAMHALSLVLAAGAYFLANTAPMAGIISLTESGNPLAVWHQLFLWSFPNYVIGAGLTAIAAALGKMTGLITLGLLMTVLYAVHKSYQVYVARDIESRPRPRAMAATAS